MMLRLLLVAPAPQVGALAGTAAVSHLVVLLHYPEHCEQEIIQQLADHRLCGCAELEASFFSSISLHLSAACCYSNQQQGTTLLDN